MDRYDAIIIGQGYAGLTAAKVAAERGLRVVNFEAMFAGGFVMNVNELHPYPEGQESSGAELVSNLAMANMDNGIEQVNAPVTSVSREGGNWIAASDERTCVAPNLIVASGSRLRKIGVPGEEEFFGRGVSECADCDGPMYGGMETVVVGGGDSAFQEALSLAHFVSKVTLLIRGDKPRARAGFVERAQAADNIEMRFNTQVLAIEGEDNVTGVRVASPDGESLLPCAGVFVFVGLAPNTDFLPNFVSRDETGAIIVDANGYAGEPGLWAIGSARSGFGGLLSDAADDAARAVAALSI